MASVKKELKDLSKGQVFLVISNSKNYLKNNIDILRFLVNERKMYGIYISLNWPYKNLNSLLGKNKIKAENLFYIDTLSETVGAEASGDKCLLISSPHSLTEISIALDKAVESVKAEKFVFLDSVSTLLLYNQLHTVAKFIHFLSGKIRNWGIEGVLISVEKGMKSELAESLVQFVDRVVDTGT